MSSTDRGFSAIQPAAGKTVSVHDADFDRLSEHLAEAHRLLARHRLVEGLVSRQKMPKQQLVENVLQRQNLGELGALLGRLDHVDVARILEALSADERLLAWRQIEEGRHDAILLLLLDEIREELVGASMRPARGASLNAFDLHQGRLRQIPVSDRADLANVAPIWVDLVAPTAETRLWVGEHFGVDLPDPDAIGDIEASARFYIDAGGETHLHSDFLLDDDGGALNIPVAFILHRDVLFSVRKKELPVFRLQRLRACAQPGYVTDGKDVLLDLYAADAEYSADALEEVYADLEVAGRGVLNPRLSDDAAARILAEIARAEDLNGRIRRNVLDTRRALSFLMRGKLLLERQQEEVRQILRDIESLDSHTNFLFGKVNFLMDATVGFININQNNRVSKLTSISLVFLPINILAGIGGMSEFSMMAQELGVNWPLAYGAFIVGAALLGWGTYHALKFAEARQLRRSAAVR